MRRKCEEDAIDPLSRIIQFDGRTCGIFKFEANLAESGRCALLLPEVQRRVSVANFLLLLKPRLPKLLASALRVMRFNPAKTYYEGLGLLCTRSPMTASTWKEQPNSIEDLVHPNVPTA